MTLELDIDPLYEEMLDQIAEDAPGDPREDLRRLAEQQIHESYQQIRDGDAAPDGTLFTSDD